MRLRPPLLLLALCWSAPWCASPARAQESALTEWIYEVRAGQFATRTMIAFVDDPYVLLPVVDLLSMVEIGSQLDEQGVLRARIEHARLELRLCATDSVATRGLRELPVPAGSVRWIGPELFVDARWFARWLGVECYLDAGELRIVYEPVYDLPIGQRILRERDRYALLQMDTAGEPAFELPAQRTLWEGGVLDWSVAAPEPTALEQSTLGARLGGSLFGGSLDLGASGRVDGVGAERFDGSWRGVWPSSRLIRQLVLGDLSSSSPHARSLRGVFVGNAPFVRSSRFGRIEISGVLEPGWEVEAHRLGQLVAFERADEQGRYRFELPLDYGQNPVEIRAYGPHGELRVLEHAARVDFDRLPAQEFEWGASSGDCPSGDCDLASNVDLRYGLHRDWTLRGGVDLFHRNDASVLDHPYLALSGSPHAAWQLRAESALEAWHSLQLGFEPNARLRAGFSWQRFDDTLADPMLQPAGERHLLRWSLLARPRAAWRSFFVHGDLRQRDGALGRRLDSDLGFSQTVRAWRLRGNWQHASLDAAGLRSERDRLQLSAQRSYLRLGSDLDLAGDGEHRWQLGYSHRLGHGTRAELGLQWSPARDDLMLTLSVLSTGDHATVSSSAARFGDGSFSSQSRAEGSILYERASERFHFEPYRSLGRGGVQGTVYLDENANGRRDPQERGLGGVRVFVGPVLITTDELGRYSAWQMMPFEHSVVRIDAGSIADPLMVPAYESAAIDIVPNGYATVDIPVIAGAEVSGVLWLQDRSGERSRLGALPVELVEVESGRVTSLRAFDDGEYYLMGVAPGRYRVRLPQHVLERTGWRLLESGELRIPADQLGSRAFEMDLVLRGVD